MAVIGDGLLGTFKYPDSTSIARTINSKVSDTLSVKDFGAVGDGIADDTAAINLAANAARAQNMGITFPPVRLYYRTSNTIDLTDIKHIDAVGVEIRGTYSGATVAILIGSDDTSFNYVTGGISVRNEVETNENTKGILIKSLNNSKLVLGARGFGEGLYFDGATTDRIIVANEFRIVSLYNNGSHVHFDMGGNSYAVGNGFVGGNYYLGTNQVLTERGTFKLTLSGSGLVSEIVVDKVEIGIDVGSVAADYASLAYVKADSVWNVNNIWFRNTRVEGYGITNPIHVVNVATNTQGRIVVDAELLSVTNLDKILGVIPSGSLSSIYVKNLSDTGIGQSNLPQSVTPNPTLPYATASRIYVPGRVVYDGANQYASPSPYISSGVASGTARAIGDGLYVDQSTINSFGQVYVKGSESMEIKFKDGRQTVIVIPRDSSGNILSGTSPAYVVGSLWRSQTYTGATVYQAETDWLWIHPDVASFYLGMSAWARPQIMKDVSFDVLVGSTIQTKSYAGSTLREMTTHASPTQIFLPIGAQMSGTSTNGWRNTFFLETTLASSAAGSATTIVVSDATGIMIGDTIGVELDATLSTTYPYTTYKYHTTTVTNVAATTLTLNNALPSAAAAGKTVILNRWVAR